MKKKGREKNVRIDGLTPTREDKMLAVSKEFLIEGDLFTIMVKGLSGNRRKCACGQVGIDSCGEYLAYRVLKSLPSSLPLPTEGRHWAGHSAAFS